MNHHVRTEADRYLASEEAAKSKGLGIRVTKIVPPQVAQRTCHG